jgi:glucose/arabinose dehydrogenase
MPRPSLLATLVLTAAAVACGGSSSPPSTSNPGDTGERVTGSERLGWTQAAANTAELATFRYAAYVDGNRVELTEVSCGSSAAAFQCSSRMPAMAPGSHTLELVSFVSDAGAIIESGRSAPLRVTVAAATAPAGSADARLRDQTTLDGVRLVVTLVSDQLESPTALAFASGGIGFLAERRGRISLLAPTNSQPGSPLAMTGLALDLPDVLLAGTSGGLLGLSVHPDFERTRFVYSLYTTAGRDGAPRFRLSRFRESGGRLGERVVLLDDVAAGGSPAGSVGFGPDGNLYVALDDGGDAGQAGQAAAYSGKVLRLNADGTTPADQPAGSPVYAAAARTPRAFDWHPVTGALWILDGSGAEAQELRVLGRGPRDSARVIALPPRTDAASMTFYRGQLLSSFQSDLFVAANQGRHLLRLRLDRRDSTRIVASERLFQDAGTPLTLVAAGADGSLYVGTDRALLRLGPG